MAAATRTPPSAPTSEAVAAFADKAALRIAASRLLAAGVKPADLSVLATHQSLEVAGDMPGYRGRPGAALFAGLTDEVNFLAPLTVAGIVLLSGGPVAAAIAALVGAGLSGAALKELLDHYTANRHSADFAAALKAGAVLLWVRVEDEARAAAALRILSEAGGSNAHVHYRATQ
jgi:hypothetical protein